MSDHRRHIVTCVKAKAIREACLRGLSWEQLALKFGVSVSTAMRHGDPDHMRKQNRYQAERYRKNPELYMERQRRYRRERKAAQS